MHKLTLKVQSAWANVEVSSLLIRMFMDFGALFSLWFSQVQQEFLRGYVQRFVHRLDLLSVLRHVKSSFEE